MAGLIAAVRQLEADLARGVPADDAYEAIVRDFSKRAPEEVEAVEALLKAVIGDKRPRQQRGRFMRVRPKVQPCL